MGKRVHKKVDEKGGMRRRLRWGSERKRRGRKKTERGGKDKCEGGGEGTLQRKSLRDGRNQNTLQGPRESGTTMEKILGKGEKGPQAERGRFRGPFEAEGSGGKVFRKKGTRNIGGTPLGRKKPHLKR